MTPGIKIECPKCGWVPDGDAHWTCSCGHEWNTFDTKGKCPACSKQWADTYCPRCGKASEHETWYKVNLEETASQGPAAPVLPDQDELLRRKRIIENKLASYGINDKITFLPYLRFDEEDFQSPYEVGCRILVLWAVSYLSYHPEEKDQIEVWLRSTVLWEKVSEREKRFFREEMSERDLAEFSWRMEAMIALSWAVNLLEELPGLDSRLTDDEMDDLMLILPLEQNPDDFLTTISYRNKDDIFIENIINEMITWHLRDKMLAGKKEKLEIDPAVSYERHYALNWVRKFSGTDDWDETDTST